MLYLLYDLENYENLLYKKQTFNKCKNVSYSGISTYNINIKQTP